ncbi:MAG: hypothetical protein IJF33_03425 [Clostridia bacterium]|nr:hypothetical protein [Clostridia bacterium]
MDTSKILIILCCFILIVCLTLCISALVVLRNAIDEHGTVQSNAQVLVDCLDSCVADLNEALTKDDSISASADAEKDTTNSLTFVLRETDGKIGVYSSDGTLLKRLNVLVSDLPKVERDALAKGISVSSWQELISIIQDYTS